MSTLQMIEKAALSLPGKEQRQLLAFLTAAMENGPASPASDAAAIVEPALSLLHPDLRAMVGIIPSGAGAERIHVTRIHVTREHAGVWEHAGVLLLCSTLESRATLTGAPRSRSAGDVREVFSGNSFRISKS